MTKAIRKLLRIVLLPIKEILFRDIYKRIEQLEYRSFNQRFYAVEQIAEYLIGAKIQGDYLEFGVFRGATFIHAFKYMVPHFPGMKFVAFDSFEGLPAPKGIDAKDGYSSHFYQNQFSCSEEEFLRNLESGGIDMTRVKTVGGWFDKTLLPERMTEYGIQRIAVAWIDCDLYESTIPVLKFISKFVEPGSVIVFDDWRCFRNDPEFGEQRACREWLEENPNIKLRKLFSFGWHGIAFTVSSC